VWPKKTVPTLEVGGALVREAHFQQKSIGRSAEWPYKRGALVIEVPI